MGQAWAVVMQVFFVCLLFIPGVRGVYSWYLLVSQVAPWLAWIAINQKIGTVSVAEFQMTIFAAWGICFATLVLAFAYWDRCTTIVDCTGAAIGAAATLVVALGLVMTNLHMLNMARKAVSSKGDESSTVGGSTGTDNQGESLQKKTR